MRDRVEVSLPSPRRTLPAEPSASMLVADGRPSAWWAVLARPETERTSPVKSASKIGSNTSSTAICTTRSFTVGMPSGRRRPSGFGNVNASHRLRLDSVLVAKFFLQLLARNAGDAGGDFGDVLAARRRRFPGRRCSSATNDQAAVQHVEPIDAVVQERRTESFGSCLALRPSFHLSSETFSGSSTPDFTSALTGGESAARAAACSVVGCLSKRVSLLLVETRFRQRPFAPRPLRRFLAITAPPTPGESKAGLFIPWLVGPTERPSGQFLSSGLSGSWIDLSVSAVPSHPGESDRCVCSLLHGRCWLRLHPAGWPLSYCVTRPNRVHVITGWHLCLPGLRPARLLSRPPSQLHGARAVTMVCTFQQTRSIRLRLTHRMNADKATVFSLIHDYPRHQRYPRLTSLIPGHNEGFPQERTCGLFVFIHPIH